eukprot:6022508-Heterocapsa_arctica.AAC.1
MFSTVAALPLGRFKACHWLQGAQGNATHMKLRRPFSDWSLMSLMRFSASSIFVMSCSGSFSR